MKQRSQKHTGIFFFSAATLLCSLFIFSALSYWKKPPVQQTRYEWTFWEQLRTFGHTKQRAVTPLAWEKKPPSQIPPVPTTLSPYNLQALIAALLTATLSLFLFLGWIALKSKNPAPAFSSTDKEDLLEETLKELRRWSTRNPFLVTQEIRKIAQENASFDPNKSLILLTAIGEKEGVSLLSFFSKEEKQKLAKISLKEVPERLIKKFALELSSQLKQTAEKTWRVPSAFLSESGKKTSARATNPQQGISQLLCNRSPTQIAAYLETQPAHAAGLFLCHLERKHAAKIVDSLSEQAGQALFTSLFSWNSVDPTHLKKLVETAEKVLKTQFFCAEEGARSFVRVAKELLPLMNEERQHLYAPICKKETS